MIELLYPMRTFLILSGVDNPNVMTADWVIPLSFNPPLVGVAIGKTRYTRELIDQHGELVIAVPSEDMKEDLIYFGTVSGRRGNKLEMRSRRTYPSKSVKVPSLQGALANVEVKVRKKVEAGDHILYIGEITGYTYDERAFPNGIPSPETKFLFHLDLEGTIKELNLR